MSDLPLSVTMSNSNSAEPGIAPPARGNRSVLHRSEYGTGRLGIISGYFQLSGMAATVQVIGLAIATFVPRFLPSGSPKPFAPLVGALVLAFGFFRTSHLLDR